MKFLKKNTVTRRLASFALAFMLSLGLVTVYVSPAMAAETTDTRAVTVIYPKEGQTSAAGYITGSRTFTYEIPQTGTYYVSYSFDADGHDSNGKLEFSGPSRTTVTLYNVASGGSEPVYLLKGTYKATLSRYTNTAYPYYFAIKLHTR